MKPSSPRRDRGTAQTPPAPKKPPGVRSPHAERGPGSASADVGMSSDGGYAEGSETGTGGAEGGRALPRKR